MMLLSRPLQNTKKRQEPSPFHPPSPPQASSEVGDMNIESPSPQPLKERVRFPWRIAWAFFWTNLGPKTKQDDVSHRALRQPCHGEAAKHKARISKAKVYPWAKQEKSNRELSSCSSHRLVLISPDMWLTLQRGCDENQEWTQETAQPSALLGLPWCWIISPASKWARPQLSWVQRLIVLFILLQKSHRVVSLGLLWRDVWCGEWCNQFTYNIFRKRKKNQVFRPRLQPLTRQWTSGSQFWGTAEPACK